MARERQPYAFRDGPSDQWHRCNAKEAARALSWKPKFEVIEWATRRPVFWTSQLDVIEAQRTGGEKHRRRSA